MKETKFVMCDGMTFLKRFPGFEKISPSVARLLRGDPDYQVRYIEERGEIRMLEFGYSSDVWQLKPPNPAS